jgi:hypothetical protein
MLPKTKKEEKENKSKFIHWNHQIILYIKKEREETKEERRNVTVCVCMCMILYLTVKLSRSQCEAIDNVIAFIAFISFFCIANFSFASVIR